MCCWVCVCGFGRKTRTASAKLNHNYTHTHGVDKKKKKKRFFFFLYNIINTFITRQVHFTTCSLSPSISSCMYVSRSTALSSSQHHQFQFFLVSFFFFCCCCLEPFSTLQVTHGGRGIFKDGKMSFFILKMSRSNLKHG